MGFQDGDFITFNDRGITTFQFYCLDGSVVKITTQHTTAAHLLWFDRADVRLGRQMTTTRCPSFSGMLKLRETNNLS